ncbi:MAG: glycine zipper 2TM domain-containing protein [Pseudomonadota bacterium]|nr:glycine zipper 2TM domain-containing protein [Pseudomonadota bacterium]
MRKMILAFSAVAVTLPAIALPTAATARRHYGHQRPYVYTRNGHTYCRHSDGTTGLIAGGVGGALIGNSVAGHGDKLLGTAIGGVVGALGGRAIDRSMTAHKRCR